MHRSSTIFTPGLWVRVVLGTYAGDIGYVLDNESLREGPETTETPITILLIPRIPTSSTTQRNPASKAKDVPPSVFRLFDPRTAKDLHGTNSIKVSHGTSFFEDNRYEHGLLVYRCDPGSISLSDVSIPSKAAYLFIKSRHPKISSHTFPRCPDWVFYEDEEVEVLCGGKMAVVVRALTVPETVEVKDDDVSGVHSWPWGALRKVVPLGSYVEVKGGASAGKFGWTLYVLNGVARIAEIGGHESETELMFDTHVNTLRIIPARLRYSLSDSGSRGDKSDSDNLPPWVGIEVVVTKVRHHDNGHIGVVEDIACGQKTKSGLSILVRLSHSAVTRFLVMDYYDIETTATGQLLGQYRNLLDIQHHFLPLKSPRYIARPVERINASGSQSPMNSASPITKASELSRVEELPRLWMLNRNLIGKKLKVKVTEGEFRGKEVVLIPSFNEAKKGQRLVDEKESVVLRWKRFSSWVEMEPEWVSVLHPNVTLGNGLLIVVAGEHCGKYVRRYDHRYDPTNMDPYIFVAVVNHGPDLADTLTGETFETRPTYLCISDETKAERDRNQSLMVPLREQHRKRRVR